MRRSIYETRGHDSPGEDVVSISRKVLDGLLPSRKTVGDIGKGESALRVHKFARRPPLKYPQTMFGKNSADSQLSELLLSARQISPKIGWSWPRLMKHVSGVSVPFMSLTFFVLFLLGEQRRTKQCKVVSL
jgi:hypothetical protein